MEQKSFLLFCPSLNAKRLDKQARTGAGARAPSLDEANDHVKESEGVSLGEAEFTFLGHPDLPGCKGGLEPSVPGTEFTVGTKFQRNVCLFAGEHLFKDRSAVTLIGEQEVW
jgi:hypothetical protein